MTEFFRVEQAEGIVIVSPLREISDLAEEGLDAAVNDVVALYAKSPATDLLIDLKFVDWLGSAMLETIVSFWQSTRAAGAKLALCNVSPVATEALKLTKLHTLGSLYESRQDAITALKA